MPIDFKIEIPKGLFDKLDQLDDIGNDKVLRDLLNRLGVEVKSQTQERISVTKTAPDGERWADNSLFTIAKKGRNDPLRDTSALLGSIRFEVSNDSLFVGTDLDYAKQHQEGNDDLNIPQRQFLGTSKQDEDDLIKLADDYLKRIIG